MRHPPARRISIFALTGLDLRVLATIASLLALYVLLNWLPTLLGDRGLSKAHASLVSMLFGIGGAVGVLILADLLDRRGRRRMIGLWHLGLIASLIALAVVNSGFLATALAGFAVGFLVSTAPLPLYGMAPCYYGMSMRGAGVGVSVADGRLGAIFGPLLAAAPLGRRRGRVGRPPGPAAQHRGGRRRHHGPDRSSAAGRLTHPRGRSGASTRRRAANCAAARTVCNIAVARRQQTTSTASSLVVRLIACRAASTHMAARLQPV